MPESGKSPESSPRIVFIDRDGVINIDPIGDYVKSWKEFKFEPSALDALLLITKLGYSIIIISNQAGIGDGIYPESGLRDIHARMMDVFKQKNIRVIDAFYCLHGKNAGCKCRKPEPGLIEQAAKKYSFEPSKTFFIGDKLTDIQLGKRCGLKTIMVLTGHGKHDEPQAVGKSQPDFKVRDLGEAAEILRA